MVWSWRGYCPKSIPMPDDQQIFSTSLRTSHLVAVDISHEFGDLALGAHPELCQSSAGLHYDTMKAVLPRGLTWLEVFVMNRSS